MRHVHRTVTFYVFWGSFEQVEWKFGRVWRF